MKIWFISINIPYQKIISKSLIKEKNKKNKEKIDDFFKMFQAKDLIYNICRFSVIEDLYLVKYEDMENDEINIFQNTIILSMFYRISANLNHMFKSIYNEDYKIVCDTRRNDEIDGYMHIKNNVFSIMCGFIVYFIKKRRTI